MRSSLDLLELLDRDARIDLRRAQILVPQHRLDEADIRTVLEHVRRHGMTEQVTGADNIDAGLLEVFLDQASELAAVERLAVVGNEQAIIVCRSAKSIAGFLDVTAEPGGRTIAERQHAVFAALPCSNGDQVPPQVDVIGFEIRQLGPPESGGVEQLHDGPVSKSVRRFDVRLVQDFQNVLDGKDGSRQFLRRLRQFQLGCRVVEQVVLAGKPSEEALHRRQHRLLTVERQRLAVGFAVVVQMPAISLQHRLSNQIRFRHATVVAPGNEPSDVGVVATVGFSGVAFDVQGLQVAPQVGIKRRVLDRPLFDVAVVMFLAAKRHS